MIRIKHRYIKQFRVTVDIETNEYYIGTDMFHDTMYYPKKDWEKVADNEDDSNIFFV